MICLLVGHRGVGKTSLLDDIKKFRPWARCYDLDTLFEHQHKISIADYFKKYGEVEFRKLEIQLLRNIVNRCEQSQTEMETYIAVGAGFEGDLGQEEWAKNCIVWWIRRESDRLGRIFLDRPKLNADLDDVEEWKERYEARQNRYRSWAWETLTLEEGPVGASPFLNCWLKGEVDASGSALTLLPENFRSPAVFASFIAKRKNWGFRYFELRNDLLNKKQISMALEQIPHEMLLLSFRPQPLEKFPPLRGIPYDWDIQLGAPPSSSEKPAILSLHVDHFSNVRSPLLELQSSAAALAQENVLLKAAVPIEKFSDLKELHTWYLEDAKQRVPCPLSKEGRWSWYRLALKGKSAFQFLREGEGSSYDQPLLWNWATAPSRVDEFAAVLGDPVESSQSPLEHSAFFAERKSAFFRIPISREESTQLSPQDLAVFGLRWAAVTSPLKKWAFEHSDVKSELAEKFESVNTLLLDTSGSVSGANTDFEGLKQLLLPWKLDSRFVLVIGQGVLEPQLKDLLPFASFVSTRKSLDLKKSEFMKEIDSKGFQTVLWSAGEAGVEICEIARKLRAPLVLDLNYRQNSGGLSFAKAGASCYVNGLGLFKRQAELQRHVWSRAYVKCESLW
jgi:shikimate 5-dehydrogenase/shikimate kinase